MKEHCAICGFSFLKDNAQQQVDSFVMRFFCPGCPLSHVAAVQLEVKDLAALAKAFMRLGLELVLGQKTYRWYGYSVGDYPVPEGFTKADLGQQAAIAVLPPKAVEAEQPKQAAAVVCTPTTAPQPAMSAEAKTAEIAAWRAAYKPQHDRHVVTYLLAKYDSDRATKQAASAVRLA